MEQKYVKMSDLVDQDFTVVTVRPFKWVAWDNENKKFKTEDNWFQGASKKYPVETDKGIVDMSATNVGNMLEGVMHAGAADITNVTFHVKSNGKTGMEIRYYINPVRHEKPAQSGYDTAKQKADELRSNGGEDANDLNGLFD